MNILVVGSGAREHAIIKALSASQKVQKIYALPGNSGIRRQTQLECLSSNFYQSKKLISFCQEKKIDLVILGPEQPLVEGWGDKLQKANIPFIGTKKEGAQLEGSKLYAKNFLKQANIPTSSFHTLKNVRETLEASEHYTPPYVFKYDGWQEARECFFAKTKKH